MIDLSKLTPGAYEVRELEAPEGYLIDDAVRVGDGEIVVVALSQLSNVGASPIGHGTASTPAWSGAPALSVDAPTSAGIWTLA